MIKIIKGWIKEYWPFLMPLMLLLPNLADFVYPGSGAPYSDVAVTHFPNAVLFKRSLLQQGDIPLWSNQILGGFPFVAHPYSGLWYPPAWLALLFPLPLGLNLLVAFQLVLAGMGMYLLLRNHELNRPAAVFGGLAFQFAPKLFAHFGAGHLMLVMSVSLTPWLLLALRRRGTGLTQPATVLALMILADPRWAIYAIAATFSVQLAHSHKENLRSTIAYLAKQGSLALLLVLPAAILYGQYGLLSTRADLNVDEVLTLSLPWGRLLGLLFPQWAGFHEWVIYPSILVLLLAIFSLINEKPLLDRRPWFTVLSVSLLLSLGENTPAIRLLAGLPGFSLLRVPPRAMFLASIALVVLAAAGLDALLRDSLDTHRMRLSVAALLGLLGGFTLLFWPYDPQLRVAPLWSAVVAGLFWLLWESYRAGRLKPSIFLLTISALLLLDLGRMDSSLLRFRDREQVLAEGAELANFLTKQDGQFRVYSPSYSLPQQTAVGAGLQLADGVDPLQFADYAEFMASASGVPMQAYSVSLPPFANGKVATANEDALPDAELLGLLNVAYVVAEFPVASAGLTQVAILDGAYVYRNDLVMPRAWLELSGDTQTVEILESGSNRISLAASGPGRIVLAEVDYPGWVARVDGESVPIERYRGILRSLPLAAGEHHIDFIFRPSGLRPALVVSGLAWLALAFWPIKQPEHAA